MKKLFNKKGFTLAELLIVVAIIGVLTVIAVPVFTSQLNKAQEATDEANERAAKAEAAAVYLNDNSKGGTAYFDAASGKLTKTAPTKAYGKTSANDGKIIVVTFTANGDPSQTWVTLKDIAAATYSGSL